MKRKLVFLFVVRLSGYARVSSSSPVVQDLLNLLTPQNGFQSLSENPAHEERNRRPFHVLLSHSSHGVHAKIASDPTGGPKRPGKKKKKKKSKI